MKNVYKPMLFSTPMVQAILDGRKTVTRRTKGLELINAKPDSWKIDGITIKGDVLTGIDPNLYYSFINTEIEESFCISSPLKTGDILRVRETFSDFSLPDEPAFLYKADLFKASAKLVKWKPSLFMPKKACRIFLEVVSVRVERLKDITVWGAEAEGVEMRLVDGDEEFKNYLAEGVTEDEPWGDSYFPNNPVASFSSLWQSLNGLEAWDLNPFVWVYKFARIEKPLDFIV